MREEAPSRETATIKATIQSETRAGVDEAGKSTWDEGDEIGVFFNGQIVKFTISEGAGTASAVFSSEVDSRGKTMDGVAIYPYDESLTLSGRQLSVKLDASNEEDSNYPSPMAGKLLSDGSFAFRNICAMLRVQYTNLPSVAQKVRLTASNTVSGIFTLSDYENGNLAVPSSTDNNVLTAFLPKRRPDGAAYVDFPLPEGELSTIKVELLDQDNKVLDTRNTASKQFTAGVIKPMEPVNIPGDRMKVEWIWDNGSLPTFRSNIPAIDDAGNVYVTTNEAALYKLDNAGHELWRAELDLSGKVETSPSVEKDGSAVYFAGGQDGAGELLALGRDGEPLWSFNDYPWSDVSPSRNYWQTFIGVGSDNIYVPVGTLCTLLSVRKADGTRVSYGSGKAEGLHGNISGPGAGCSVGLGGTVSFMTTNGAYSWNKALLDAPEDENVTYGKYALWGYQDLWPGWGAFKNDKQGVISARKGSSGENVIISCAQESKGRIDVVCYPASFARDNTMTRHDDELLKYYWRHQIGTNTNDAAAPAMQDQGGIVMGHENLVCIVPMKYRSNATDAKIGNGGLYSVWVGRNASVGDGGTACWRVAVGSNSISGAAAVDNNGNVHFASDKYYYIIKPNTNSGGSYETIAKVNIRNLLLGSGQDCQGRQDLPECKHLQRPGRDLLPELPRCHRPRRDLILAPERRRPV